MRQRGVLGWWRRIKRRRFDNVDFPEAYREILEEHVAFYNELGIESQATLQTMVLAFIHEKYFVGAQGLVVTDTHRVVIAAAAARLVLGLDLSYYDRLTEIVIYEGDYRHKDREGIILGEAHTWGTVVLSWSAVLRGVKNPDDGHDTAIHEFAHVLDVGSGAFDGTPILRADEDYKVWGETLGAHFVKLRGRGPRRRSLLRQYGATNEAEFFAVATEAFFEKPEQMRARAPELYDELARFYGRDPKS